MSSFRYHFYRVLSVLGCVFWPYMATVAIEKHWMFASIGFTLMALWDTYMTFDYLKDLYEDLCAARRKKQP